MASISEQDLRDFMHMAEELAEALQHCREIHSVSVCFMGQHVKQLDGSVKYELVPTMHQKAKEKADLVLEKWKAHYSGSKQ